MLTARALEMRRMPRRGRRLFASITPAVKCRRILRRINFHLQGGRRRRSGATSTDDNAANGNLGK